MRFQGEQWIQTDKGIWLPEWRKVVHQNFKKQIPQKIKQEAALLRDWGAYWKGQGQPWRREPEIGQERQQFLLQRLEIEVDFKQGRYPFKEITLTRADIEWLIEQNEQSLNENNKQQWLYLRGAILNDVNLIGLPLKGADFGKAQLKGADFGKAQLEGADFGKAQLEGTSFWEAQLEGAYFRVAQLKGADFRAAQLKGADFLGAQLEGADFLVAQLEGADFGEVRLGRASFREAHFANARGVGPSFANATGWDEVFLAHIEWSQLKILGEEAEAKKESDASGKIKEKLQRLDDHRVAARTYRQLATALEAQGLKEEAERFAYRAQMMQRKVLWWRIWQEKNTLLQRVNNGGIYLFSLLLALLTGYGYRFGRSLVSYSCVLVVFTLVYSYISRGTTHPLEWIDALVLSISNMVGRGFFRQDVSLSDPYAYWSVLEGMIGVFMDVLLISTLTQRLFKK